MNNFEHEYSVLGGINRAAIGRYLSIVASLVATGLGMLVVWGTNLAKTLGWADHVPGLVLWPITAGLLYSALYWWFNSKIWRIPKLAELLKVPYLAGTWTCEGQQINSDKSLGYAWQGSLTIIQSWDKLRIRLKTGQSSSSSIAAALVYDQADGFRLLYNYKNDPRIDAAELSPHRGCAELVFAPDLQSATGEYFNGHGRYTFGTMTLKREGDAK